MLRLCLVFLLMFYAHGANAYDPEKPPEEMNAEEREELDENQQEWLNSISNSGTNNNNEPNEPNEPNGSNECEASQSLYDCD